MNTQGNSSLHQLVLVVEGTAALGPYWSLLRSEYIDKIIRSFSGNEPGSQKSSGPNIRMQIVQFYCHGPHSVGSVRRSGWTSSLDTFQQWLSNINFCAGGLGEVAIAEGLADALTLLASSQSLPQMTQGMDSQSHCVLVAASNPYPLATPVPRPYGHTPSQQNTNSEFQPMQWVADADTVAKSFVQYAVSLSVIAPKQLPKLKSVYNAGKQNPSATDSVMENMKYPQHLVLLSESFMDACSALSCSGPTSLNASTNLMKTDTTSAATHSVPLQPQTTTVRPSSGPGVSGVMTGYPQATNRTILQGIVKTEIPSSVPLTSAPGLPHMTSGSLLHGTSQGAPGQYSTSSVLSTQDTKANIDATDLQDFKSIAANASQQLRTATPSTTNVNLLNNLSRSHLPSAALPGASTLGLQTGIAPVSMQASSLLANGMSSAPILTSQNVQVSGQPGLTSTGMPVGMVGVGQIAPNVSQNSFVAGTASLGVGQPVSSVNAGINGTQGTVGMGQSVPGIVNGGMTTGSLIGQTGVGMSQNVLSAMGPVGISSGSGTMVPKPTLNQSVQLGNLQALGGGNTSAGNLQLPSTATTTQQPGGNTSAKYTKVWEVCPYISYYDIQNHGQDKNNWKWRKFKNPWLCFE